MRGEKQLARVAREIHWYAWLEPLRDVGWYNNARPPLSVGARRTCEWHENEAFLVACSAEVCDVEKDSRLPPHAHRYIMATLNTETVLNRP